MKTNLYASQNSKIFAFRRKQEVSEGSRTFEASSAHATPRFRHCKKILNLLFFYYSDSRTIPARNQYQLWFILVDVYS